MTPSPRGGRTGGGAYIHCPIAPSGGRQRVKPDPRSRPRLPACPSLSVHLAAMLPLADLPAEWTVGKSGERHLETFNAENLYEKIDGRAESFIQYGVKGMAYTFYHPAADPSNELQLYVFEMADSLKALGKYGLEKPDEVKTVAIGTEGYTSAGSTLFYSGKYYTQIVSTQDDPKFAAFALELAKRVAARQTAGTAAPTVGRPGFHRRQIRLKYDGRPTPRVKPTATVPAEVTPASYFAMLPAGASGRLQVRCPGRFWL